MIKASLGKYEEFFESQNYPQTGGNCSKGLFVCRVNKIIFFMTTTYTFATYNLATHLNHWTLGSIPAQFLRTVTVPFSSEGCCYEHICQKWFMCFRISLGSCCYSKSSCADSTPYWIEIYDCFKSIALLSSKPLSVQMVLNFNYMLHDIAYLYDIYHWHLLNLKLQTRQTFFCPQDNR